VCWEQHGWQAALAGMDLSVSIHGAATGRYVRLYDSVSAQEAAMDRCTRSIDNAEGGLDYLLRWSFAGLLCFSWFVGCMPQMAFTHVLV
jgi:hypothetical protein